MNIISQKLKEHGLSEFHPKDRTSIAVIVKNSEEKYLIMQRSFEDTDGAGLWDIVGGSVDTHDPHECAIRELKEEAGLDAKKLSYFTEKVYH
ncbi:MAG: NUDIX hydrolase, partial [Patescibacteria group bacterium]